MLRRHLSNDSICLSAHVVPELLRKKKLSWSNSSVPLWSSVDLNLFILGSKAYMSLSLILLYRFDGDCTFLIRWGLLSDYYFVCFSRIWLRTSFASLALCSFPFVSSYFVATLNNESISMFLSSFKSDCNELSIEFYSITFSTSKIGWFCLVWMLSGGVSFKTKANSDPGWSKVHEIASFLPKYF